MEKIKQSAKQLGFRFEDVPLTLATLTTPASTFLRLSEDDMVDLKTGQMFDLIVE